LHRPEPYFDDEWAERQANAFLLDDSSGYFPPNASFGGEHIGRPAQLTRRNAPLN
jgi:hypothetical protein